MSAINELKMFVEHEFKLQEKWPSLGEVKLFSGKNHVIKGMHEKVERSSQLCVMIVMKVLRRIEKNSHANLQ